MRIGTGKLAKNAEVISVRNPFRVIRVMRGLAAPARARGSASERSEAGVPQARRRVGRALRCPPHTERGTQQAPRLLTAAAVIPRETRARLLEVRALPVKAPLRMKGSVLVIDNRGTF